MGLEARRDARVERAVGRVFVEREIKLARAKQPATELRKHVLGSNSGA